MTYIHREISAEGEVSERPYTKEETAQVEKARQEAQALAELTKLKEAARVSALSKLIDLGLTEEEIAAL